jgi:hypothetical protein
MMYGTPGGIVLIFNGEVAYLCLAIMLALIKEVASLGKIRPASATPKVFRTGFRSPGTRLSLPDRLVLSELLASGREDVFHKMSTGVAGKSTQRRPFGEGEPS